MTIAIASDLSGFPLKKALTEHLKEQGHTILDFGIESEEKPQPYFIQAPKVAKAIQKGEAEQGILVCGTGQGMAIVPAGHVGLRGFQIRFSVPSGPRSSTTPTSSPSAGGSPPPLSPPRSLMHGWR